MKRALAALAFAAIATSASAQRPAAFAVGQVWTLKDAPPAARFTVMQIDVIGSARVIHGSPTGFPPVVANGAVYTVSGGHMPFAEDALRRSVDKLGSTGAEPTAGFRAGYAQWKAANGGWYSITVSQAMEAGAETLRRGQAR